MGKKEHAKEMRVKSEDQPGESAHVDGAGYADTVLLSHEISDDELNVLIERAVEDAELLLAGTSVAGSSDCLGVIDVLDEQSEFVH